MRILQVSAAIAALALSSVPAQALTVDFGAITAGCVGGGGTCATGLKSALDAINAANISAADRADLLSTLSSIAVTASVNNSSNAAIADVVAGIDSALGDGSANGQFAGVVDDDEDVIAESDDDGFDGQGSPG